MWKLASLAFLMSPAAAGQGGREAGHVQLAGIGGGCVATHNTGSSKPHWPHMADVERDDESRPLPLRTFRASAAHGTPAPSPPTCVDAHLLQPLDGREVIHLLHLLARLVPLGVVLPARMSWHAWPCMHACAQGSPLHAYWGEGVGVLGWEQLPQRTWNCARRRVRACNQRSSLQMGLQLAASAGCHSSQ